MAWDGVGTATDEAWDMLEWPGTYLPSLTPPA